MNPEGDSAQQLSALPEFGSDFKGALDTFFSQPPEVQNQQLNSQVETATAQPTEQVTQQVEHKEIKIGDDPLEFIADSPEQSTDVDAEQEPDFDAELNEKFKEEPGDAKGKARWGELRGELKSVKQRAYQYERSLALKEKEIAELKAKTPAEGETNEWRQKYEGLLKENPLIALQANEEFQQKVAQPYWQAKDFVDQAVGYFGLDRAALAEAVKVPGVFERTSALAEVFNEAKGKEMLPEQRNQVMRALEQESALEGKFNEAHDHAVTLYEGAKQKQAESQRQSYEQRKMELMEAEKDVFERLTKNAQFKATFNGKSAEMKDKVIRALQTESTPKMAVYEKYSSFALAPTLQALEESQKEIASLKATLSKYVQGGAAAGAGSAASPVPEAQGSRHVKIGDDLADALAQAQGGTRWQQSKF